MYASLGSDQIVENTELPQASTGSPNPVILANDRACVLAYAIEPDEEWVIVTLSGRTIYFGPPNDETLQSHPLYEKGLKFYAMHEVLDSSWISQLEKQNRVHRLHNPERFSRLRHFIWTFHDSTFEIVAEKLDWQNWRGNSVDLLGAMGQHLKSPPTTA